MITLNALFAVTTPLFTPNPGWIFWSFFTSTLLLITLFCTLFIYIKKQHAHQLEELRIKISSDLHDDVGSLLSGLAMQAEILGQTAPETDQGKWQKIAEQSRKAMLRMRDVVWVIDSRKDKWMHLTDRLYEYAEETLSPVNISFELHLQGISTNQSIAAELRQHLLLIGKEAITNVARHSNAKNVTMLFRQKTKGNFDMQILDDGELPTKKKKYSSGLGLSNMKWRAQQLGAKLRFEYHNGFGIYLNCIRVV